MVAHLVGLRRQLAAAMNAEHSHRAAPDSRWSRFCWRSRFSASSPFLPTAPPSALADGEAQLAAEAQRWRTLEAAVHALPKRTFGRPSRADRAQRFRHRTRVARVAGGRRGNAALVFTRAGAEFCDEPGAAGQRIGYRLRGHAVEIAYWPQLDNAAKRRSRPSTSLADRRRRIPRRVSRPAPARGATAGRCKAKRDIPRAVRVCVLTLRRRRADRAMVRPALKSRSSRRRAAAGHAGSRRSPRSSPSPWRRSSSAGSPTSPTAATSAGAGARAGRRPVGAADPAGRCAQSGIIDHLGEAWAYPLPRTPLENGLDRGRHRGCAGAAQHQQPREIDDALGKEERAAPRAVVRPARHRT